LPGGFTSQRDRQLGGLPTFYFKERKNKLNWNNIELNDPDKDLI
jgi:hypothetical protein